MTPTITAFEKSPDGGKGLARDTRVRWALEEVGQPYEVRLVSFSAMKEPAHLAIHPFGKIPTYEEGDLALFETGAIVFHIAERHAGLLPERRCPGARDHLDVRRAQYGGAADPRTRKCQTPPGRKPWTKSACRSSWIAPVNRWANFPLAWAMPTGWRCVQRRRPDDGVGTAQAESVGLPGRISEPLRRCRPR